MGGCLKGALFSSHQDILSEASGSYSPPAIWGAQSSGHPLREGSRALVGKLDPSKPPASRSVRNHRYSMYLITLNYCWDSS